jgi:predicted DNA-binding transcriptional regulator AlpA
MSTTHQTSITAPPKKQRGHTAPKAPIIGLDQPGRLRVAHLLAILGISHATLYAGLKTGRYPEPDGRDGKFCYWKTSTIRAFLDA